MAEPRPAFYALAPGGWRDYVTLLHPPYTAWHLSYVVVGAGLAPELQLDRLGATLGAFLLGMGIGAHALDELVDRPLQTTISRRRLAVLGTAAVAAAVGIGVWSMTWISAWLAPFVVFGGFIAVAYNLELGGRLFHNPFWFDVAWGAFPVLTGYFAQAETIRLEAVLAAGFAAVLSEVQRRLSTPVRLVRRRVRAVSGTIELVDGTRAPVGSESLMGAPEAALQALSLATCLLATSLVVARL